MSAPPIEVAPRPLSTARWLVRRGEAADQSYIACSWVRSMQRVKGRATLRVIGEQVDALLDRTDTQVRVAHAIGDNDAIIGWIAWTKLAGTPVLHYVLTRQCDPGGHRLRGLGVARQLLGQAGLHPDRGAVFTFRGPSAPRLQRAYPAAAFMDAAEFLR